MGIFYNDVKVLRSYSSFVEFRLFNKGVGGQDSCPVTSKDVNLSKEKSPYADG